MVHFTKTSKYTLGEKIDSLLIETIENATAASFLSKSEKAPYVRKAAIKLDMAKVFLQIAFEIKELDEKKYFAISEILREPGKMLGGWHNQLAKQNSPIKTGEK